VQHDDLAAKVQSSFHSLDAFAALPEMLETEELLEDPLAELRGDPRSGIHHLNSQQIGASTSRLYSHGDLDSAIAGCELQSVREQVGKDHTEPGAYPRDDRLVAPTDEVKPNPILLETGKELVDDVPGQSQ
jgi:hypothetical protein